MNSCLEFLRVVEVYCYDVGFADILFRVRVLRWHLMSRRKHVCYLSWVHYTNSSAPVHFHSSQLWRSEKQDYMTTELCAIQKWIEIAFKFEYNSPWTLNLNLNLAVELQRNTIQKLDRWAVFRNICLKYFRKYYIQHILNFYNKFWLFADRPYLSGCGLPSEELMVEGAARGAELWLQEHTAIGYGL